MGFEESKVDQCVWFKNNNIKQFEKKTTEQGKTSTSNELSNSTNHKSSKDGAIVIVCYIDDCVVFSKRNEDIEVTIKKLKS